VTRRSGADGKRPKRRRTKPAARRQKASRRSRAPVTAAESENARLIRELNEARDQQAATAEVLRIISASPGDVQPVFDAIVSNARRLCGARFGNLLSFDGKNMRIVVMQNASREHTEMRQRDPIVPLQLSILGPLVKTKALVHIADIPPRSPMQARLSPRPAACGRRWPSPCSRTTS
jgi:hypothetical protein